MVGAAAQFPVKLSKINFEPHPGVVPALLVAEPNPKYALNS
jgi:hypothetical protein